MDTKALIESGILELYCIGATTPEQNALIEIMISNDDAVGREIDAIQKSLVDYAGKFAVKPPDGLLNKILNNISSQEANEMELPALLSAASKASDWWKYIRDAGIVKPDNDMPLNMIEFASGATLVTYIAWAEKGAVVEEKHADETERLFMLQGECKIEMNGKTFYYKEGDFIDIPANTLHRAESTGDEMMIAIGQRLAA